MLLKPKTLTALTAIARCVHSEQLFIWHICLLFDAQIWCLFSGTGSQQWKYHIEIRYEAKTELNRQELMWIKNAWQ